MSPTLDEIVNGVVELIQTLDSIGTVDSKKNGESTWSSTPLPGQFYWIVDHCRTAGKKAALGGQSPGSGVAKRQRVIRIDAWMPWSFAGATAEEFNDKINEVEWLIIQNRTLGVCAKTTSLIELAFNKIEPYTSLHQGDESRMCHHARWEMGVTRYRELEGT